MANCHCRWESNLGCRSWQIDYKRSMNKKMILKKYVALLVCLSFILLACSPDKPNKASDFTIRQSNEDDAEEEPIVKEEKEYIYSPAPPTTCDRLPLCGFVRDTCDGLGPCRYVRDSSFMHYYTYDMFHIYDVSVTPNRVVCALVGLYVVCKLPIFRWKRTLFGQRNFATEYGELARRSQGIYDGNNSIFDWLHRRWRSVFKHKHKHKSPHERSLGLPPYSFTSCSSTSSSISPTPQLLTPSDFK